MNFIWDEDAGRRDFRSAIETIEKLEKDDPSGLMKGILCGGTIETMMEELIHDSIAYAADTHTPFTTHGSQCVVEFLEMTKRHGMSPIQWADSVGMLGPHTIVGHGLMIDAHSWIRWHTTRDLDILAATGTSVAHCPTPFSRYGQVMEDFGRYVRAGVNMGMGTDTFPHNMIDADTVVGADGRTQEVAVMFCDIRDFTSLTEKMPPSDVVRFLSQYHALMVEVIFAFRGTIDKFIGDAIMVTFGTPDPSEDDAERSVRAALAMNNALAGLNADRERRGLAAIRHGIGIHFGPVIGGNIGSEDRLEYTVIGDTVNVASRIQDACKSVGEGLLISDAVQRQLPPDIEVSPLPEQHVKGRQAPVQIYAVKEKLEALGIA